MLEILNTMRFYEDSHAKIDFLPQNKIIQFELINYLANDSYKNIMQEAIKIAKNVDAIDWILDTRRFYGTSYEMQEWTNSFWSGLAVENGMKCLAIVLPRSIYGYFSVLNSIGQNISSKVNIKKFMDYEGAFRWLQSVSVSSPCAA